MSLIDRYLAAVAAQLKPAEREDVVAELRDDIMSRVEAREEELGRALSDDEVEAVLRELGHPLTVAARYGAGPQHLIGPELFPWWLFAMKVGLAAIALLSVLGVITRMGAGDMSAGQAFAQAFRGFFDGGLTLLGIVTVVGFIWERYGGKPDFITHWKVKDLGVFELGRLNTDGLGKAMGTDGGRADKAKMSPTARALGSATGMTVLLLWWIGVIPTGGSWSDLQVTLAGVDYTRPVEATFALLYWPVIVYAAARILFDLFRAVRPQMVRLTALGDIGLAAARAVLGVWVLFASPMAAVLGVTDPASVWERIIHTFTHGGWDVLTTVILILVCFPIEAAWRIGMSLVRLASGRDRRLDQA